ncbi:MAG TPA: hypothetical protein VNE82_00040 [Candidatus Binataceae bacterium]|nr:hypothetical protein [Candidatus Binataceae bacterium]
MTLTLALGAILGFGLTLLPNLLRRTEAASAPELRAPPARTGRVRLHTHEEFKFVASAPIHVTAPLFGAERERVWAPDWDPKFVWPENPNDQEGMVFTLAHGGKTATWVNTSFDLEANRIQYVYVIPDTLVTVVTVTLTANAKTTDVAVAYDRTALTETANIVVREMAERDANAGPEWGKQINGYLRTRS